MTRTEKPYRVYRGGRIKGRVPLQRRVDAEEQDGRRPGTRVPRPRRPRKPWSWQRRIGVALLVLVLLVAVWAIASYIAVREGVNAANERLPVEVRATLDEQDALLLSNPTIILLLGTDHSPALARSGLRHSDSILLLRTDPDRHRLAYLSIPRDLKVPIPGHGDDKINAAFQMGGPALAVRTVKAFTGLPVHHVAIVDFGAFRKVIDELGGVDVHVPEPILSNRFDCPYTTERCARWNGWRFRKGTQHMDGRRALVYSRIRENRLNPADSDVTRGERQQAVLQAIMGKLSGPRTLVKLPFVGGDLLRPLATDLTTWQLTQLGWVKKRAPSDKELHCRLGGDAADFGGQSVIVSSEDNRAVIQMVLGLSAPQPPRPGSGPFGPGCIVGSRPIGSS